jgi:uncharacterized protein DUF3617
MNRALRLAAAAACLLPVLALAADRPNVKLGLWEVSRDSGTAGVPAIPEDQLARLPPEARARIAAARGPGPHTSRHCLADRDLGHLFQGTDDRERACTRTVVSQTATALELSLSCKSPQLPNFEAHGTVKWQLTSPETATGTIDMTTSMGAQPVTNHMQLSAKWLGADCGDVRPAAAPGQ